MRQAKASRKSHGFLGRRNKGTLRTARDRRRSSQRVSFIERLEPRVVLNGAPVAVPDPWYTTTQNTTLTVTTQGTTLVANDWDPEGSAMTASHVSGPSNGTLGSLQSNGTFTYTPNTGFRGFDTFQYRVSDGTANSNTVEARIAVGGYLGPRTNQDEVSQDLSMLNGSLGVVTPLTPGLSLVYQSDTQSNAIVTVETSLLATVPTAISAQLTFNGTAGTNYGYSTTGLTAGRSLRFAQEANTSALATGRYNWQMDVTTTTSGVPTVHSFTGSTNVVNRNGATAPFGRGWQLAGLDQLVSQTGGMLFVQSGGTTLWFADNGTGGYLHAEGDETYSTLVKNANLTYTLTDTHGDQANFSTAGLLTSHVDANANTTSYTYTSGLLTQITDPFGRNTTLTYTSGRLTSVSDFAGRTATLVYDGSGRLTSVTQPDPDGAGAQTAPVTAFAYNATTHRMSSTTNPLSQVESFAFGTHGRLTTITHPDMSYWQQVAIQTVGLPTGTSGNTISVANPNGSVTNELNKQSNFRTDRFGRVLQWTDPLTHTTLTQRNADGVLIRLTGEDPDGTDSATSPITVYGFDTLGNLVYRKNPDGYSATWTYTATFNRVATAINELGDDVSFRYDSYGNQTSATDALGYVTTATYNSRGLPTSVTTPDPDGAGQLAAAVTGLDYDSYGRLTTLTNPDNTTRTFGYNTADMRTSETDELNHTTSYVCDTLDRLTSQTDRTNAQTSFVYNAVGLLTQQTDALGKVTDWEYNNRGWLVHKYDPDPDGTGSLPRPQSTYGYDLTGNLTSMGQPDFIGDMSLQYGYDDAGRRVSEKHTGDINFKTFDYDNLDRVIKVTDQLSNTTVYAYNWRGQVTQEDRASAIPPGMGDPPKPTMTRKWEYDPLGQLTAEVDARNYRTSYVWDARGQLLEAWQPDPDGEEPGSQGPAFRTWTRYSYDRVGRVIQEEDTQLRVTAYAYNSRDLMTQMTLPDPDGSGSATSPVISMSYDNAGRAVSQTDPLSRVTPVTYDHEGRVLTVTSPDPDGGGPLSAPVQTYTYNALGSVLTSTDAAGHVTSWQYDALQRPTQMTEPDPDGSDPLTSPVTVYTYGSNSSLSQLTDAIGRDVTFQYDSRGRRTGVTDELGNQTTYAYDSLDQVTSVTAPDPDGTGPLTAPVTAYTYNYLQRLSTVAQPGGGSLNYSYDAAGNLVSLVDPVGNETTYAYDGQGRLQIETNEAGQWRSYEYNLLGDVSRLRDRNGRVLQFEHDLLGRLTSEQWRSGADPGPSLAIATTTQGGPVNEVQRVGFTTTGSFMGGSSFTLTYNGQTTAAIAHTATAEQVQAALEALSNVAPGDVVVTKTQDTTQAREWTLAFQGALAGSNLVQTTIDISNIRGFGTKTKIEATDVQGGTGGNEVQTVTLSNATGGTFRLAFEGYVTTPLAYNATAAQVDAALDALASVDNVTVTGNAGGPWTVTFGGTQAGINVSRMGGDATAATTGTLVRTLSYTYDAASQLTAASDPDSSYAISYDNLGRVLTVDNNGTSGVPRVILTSAYDVVGNRTSLSASVAGTADFLNTFTHDALDRLTRVDQTGQTGGNTVSEKRVDLAYNAIGQYTSIARYKDTDGGTANEVATAGYSYDTLGRLTGLAYTKGGSNLFTPYSWTYDSLSSSGMGFDGSATVSDPRVAATAAAAVFDAMGRITQMVSQDGTSTYGYDSKSQLTSADHSYQSDEAYTFDHNGNRTMSGYQTGTDNRLTNDGTYSYTYDAEGNRLTRTKTATGEVTEYTWDYHNRLTKVTEKNSQGTVTQVVEYIYDVFNRRIGRKIDTSTPFDMANAVIERYVLDDIHNGLTSADGGNVVLDFVDTDGSGAQAIAMSKRYLYGEAVDQLFAQEDLSKTLGDTSRNLWPLVDHLGTVRDLAKQDGTIAAHFKYDSFGNVTSGDTSKTRYLFTSREFDTATKLQYNRARYYDAAVGRWISEDPLGFAAGDANVGRYVGNGPTGMTDPSGQSGFWHDYWYYLWNPSKMDDDIQVAQKGALVVSAGAGVAAGGLIVAGYGTVTVGAAWGAAAPVVGSEIVDTAVEEGIGYVTGVPVILPVSPIDLIQDVTRVGIKKGIKRGVIEPGLPACFVGGTLVCVPGVNTEETIFVTAGTCDSESNWLASSAFVVAALAIQLPFAKRRKRRKQANSIDGEQMNWGYPTETRETPSVRDSAGVGSVGSPLAGESRDKSECGGATEEAGFQPSTEVMSVPARYPTTRFAKLVESSNIDERKPSPSSSDFPRTPLPQRMASAFQVGLAGLLLFAASLVFRTDSSEGPPVVSHLTATLANVPDRFAAIEQIRVGERVFADNPDRSAQGQNAHTAVDPRTWQHLVLQADFQWPDGTPDPINVETLQPQEWMVAQQAAEGREVDLPLDLREMGLPEDLRARVLRVQPCPTIAPGPGHVVLTTVNHLHNHVVELIVRDERGEREAIRPTGFHKFYSETRHTWVSAEDLQVDEVLAGRNGPLVVVSQSRVSGIHRVFNMTVEGEHVYHVGNTLVTAHNNGCAAPNPPVKNPRFGTPEYGTEIHQQFEDALIAQTGTIKGDWHMGTAPGLRGPDASYIGPAIRYPGFGYAELKPATPSGFNRFFFGQLPRWDLPPGETQLWYYNQWGVIGSGGVNF